MYISANECLTTKHQQECEKDLDEDTSLMTYWVVTEEWMAARYLMMMSHLYEEKGFLLRQKSF